MRIAAVGEICEDEIVLASGEVSQMLGGISCNFARCAYWAGAESSLFAPIGTDPRADRLAGALRATGVVGHLRRMEGMSAVQKTRIDARGERKFEGFSAGVCDGYQLTSEEVNVVATHDVVSVPASEETRTVYEQVLSMRGPKIVVDYSIDSLSREQIIQEIEKHSKILFVAFVGGDQPMIAPLRALAQEHELCIVLTVGKDGAHAFYRQGEWHEPARAIEVVDTTGCGDAFGAAFSATYTKSLSVPRALLQGTECAARVAQKLGGGL